jgi:hypothetical protein
MCSNIGDGRGYTIGKAGFCTGTGDFILVAACYNDRKPGNILQKYWGRRDATGKAVDGLIYYNDRYWSTGMNQGATALIDSLGNFCRDEKTASTDPVFTGCQDDMANALYMSAALTHATERHLNGPLTIGFLYDTELNFGEDDDPGPPVLGGTKTVISKADADYGARLPADFTGKTWEESRWLGFVIQERVIEMSGNVTWKTDVDQNATWEAARRLHTAASNNPETGTDLSMTYDITSKYKGGFTPPNPACWKAPPLLSKVDSGSTTYTVGINKMGSTNQSLWKATGTLIPGNPYAACPSNPTP